MEEKKKYAAPAVERAMDIIEIMVRENRSFTVTEMSRILDVSVNSIFRIFTELEEKSYVVKDSSDSSYELSPKLYYMGNAIKGRFSLITNARPFMKQIARKTGETAVLTKLNENFKTLLVEQVESDTPIKCTSTVGIIYDSYISAMGKVMIAYSSPELIEEYMDLVKLKKVTEHTITSKVAFRKELEEIRRAGVGFDREESIVGMTCIASPILSAGGNLVGAVGITGISFRMGAEERARHAEVIREEAQRLSHALGYDSDSE